MSRGGKRTGSGRPKGARNRANNDQKLTLSELAKIHAPGALNALAEVMTEGQSEAARVSAAIAILDRAFGKPAICPAIPEIDSEPFARALREIREAGSKAPINRA